MIAELAAAYEEHVRRMAKRPWWLRVIRWVLVRLAVAAGGITLTLAFLLAILSYRG